ncbi:MAG: phosphate signaling complex protein PhoU [Gammaproteobacteria bacterium]|nr:phosphate signaling complex protein PhoU [Gammaproteobacteria bacterium]
MNSSSFSHHISKKYNHELEEIRTQVSQMGGLVQKQTLDAVNAMLYGDTKLAEDVITQDHTVNRYEVTIDEECTRILALRQPTAGDLRLVIAMIKSITDLERIGDQAGRIAHFAIRMGHSRNNQQDYYLKLNHLSERVNLVLEKTLQSLLRLDTELAISVVKMDASIDNEYDSIMRQLSTYMMEDPRNISHVLDAMWVARALERIGDHAQNICEYVIYLVKGKNIRHVAIDEKERAASGDS